jgi:putative ABC transport system permease protein
MRLTDLMVFPVVALWQQKSRTALTTLGVVFGAFVLAASLSINQGVQETIARESHRTDALRRIHVYPDWGSRPTSNSDEEIIVKGTMSDAKRQRIRAALAPQQPRATSPSIVLSEESLKSLSALEHVQSVEPNIGFMGHASFDDKQQRQFIESARPQDPAFLRRLVAGRFFESAEEPSAVVSELQLYVWGIIDDDQVKNVLGRKLRIEIRSRRDAERPSLHVYLAKPNGGETTSEEIALVTRLNGLLPQAVGSLDLSPEELEILRQMANGPSTVAEDEVVISEELTIVGVFRQVTEEELKDRRWWDDLGGGADLYLPYQTAANFYFRAPVSRVTPPQRAMLIAESEENVKQIVQVVKDMGLRADAPIEFIERERLTWRLVFGGMTCIAAVALIVAATGIANTMLMSVLERTREIGVMKAVGAAGAHIQAMFLIEGGLIGTAGGCLGLALAWGASIPGDAWVRSMVERDMNVKLIDKLFIFPPWLVVTVLVFAVVVTTGAALYPARRAARVDPVAALRHE